MPNFNGIAVLIPSSGRFVPIEWGLSLASLQFPVGMSVAWFMSKSDPEKMKRGEITRDMQREALCDRAIEIGAPYVLFMDDDTIMPNYGIQHLHRALANNPDAAICGGIYCTKEEIPTPIVFDKIGGGPYYNWTVGDVFEVEGLGTGAMMIRTSVFAEIPKPWFKDTQDAPIAQAENYNGVDIPVAKNSGTDDIYFCAKVLKAGKKILAHGGVLPVHVDQFGKFYTLPLDTYPCRSFDERQKNSVEKKSKLAGSSGLSFDEWTAKLDEEEATRKALIEDED